MTAQKETVVTAERLTQGISYEEWMAQIDRNVDKFEENYAACTIDPEEVAKIKAVMAKPNGPHTVLALAEAFCPDVFRGLPVMARLCGETGLELKIFFREQNLDIMNEFLNRGEFQSVPTFVFYTKDARYIAHWIERAVLANEQMPLLDKARGKLRDPNATPEERQQGMAAYVEFQRGPIWDGWRRAQVTEIRELLEANS